MKSIAHLFVLVSSATLLLFSNAVFSNDKGNSKASTSSSVEVKDPIGPSSDLKSLLEQTSVNAQDLSADHITGLKYSVYVNIGEDYVDKTYTKLWYYPNFAEVQDNGYEEVYFNQGTDEVLNLEAVTKTASGHIIPFNIARLQTLDSDTYNVFSDSKIHIVNYPAVDIGSITGIQYTVRTDRSKLETHWSMINYPKTTVDRLDYEFVVSNPKGLDIHLMSTADEIECSKSGTTTRCFADKLNAIDTDNAWYFRDEAPFIVVSEVNDWSDVIEELASGFRQATQDNQKVSEKLKSLINEEMSGEEKIDAIHSFVSRDIRYVSESETGHAVTPHSVSRTLEKRYGDCKDKTALLVEMFSQIGLNAYPVLVSTNRMNAENIGLPSSQYFNHAIACFLLEDQEYCIDATDDASDWRYTSAWNQGKVSLPLVESGKVQTIHTPEFKWTLSSKIDIQLDDVGGQNEQQVVTFANEYAAYQRGGLSRQTAEEKRDWAIEMYQAAVADEATPEVEISGVDGLRDSITLRTSNSFEPYFDTAEDLNLYERDPWILYEINSYDFQNKVYDEFFPGFKVESTMSVDTGERWALESLPSNLDLVTEYATLARHVEKVADGKFIVKTRIEAPSRKLSPDSVKEFYKVMDALKDNLYVEFTGELKK